MMWGLGLSTKGLAVDDNAFIIKLKALCRSATMLAVYSGMNLS